MAVDLPPGVAPIPSNPPPALSDADPETRARRLREAMDAQAVLVKAYIDALWREYAPWVRWRLGTATALSAATRTVTVQLDPGPAALAAVEVRADWGRPTWTAAQIVGKRVRVLIDTNPRGGLTPCVDDVVEAP